MASLDTKLQEKESLVNDPYAINEVSYQMGTLNYEGNMTPHSWFQHIKRKNKKTDSIAINLLSEIVYWYRPYCVREGSREIWKKKYIADILQKSYAELEEKFGYTKDQMRDSFKLLQNLGLVLLEFRTVHKNGVTNSNVMFIRVFPEKIKEITESELKKFVPSSEISDDPLIGNFRLGSGKFPTTYTQTSLKNSKSTTPTPPSFDSPKPQNPREASASRKRASAPVGGFSKNEKKEASPGSRKRASPNLDCPPDPEKMKVMEPLQLLEAEAFIHSHRYSLENVQIGVDYTLMIIEKGTMKKSIAEVFNWAAKNPEKALQSLGKSSSSKDQEKRKEVIKSYYPFNYHLTHKGYRGYGILTTSTSVSIVNAKGEDECVADISDENFYEKIDYIRQKTGK